MVFSVRYSIHPLGDGIGGVLGEDVSPRPKSNGFEKTAKKQALGALTRTRFLDAAEAIFSEKGFRSTSTREIARRAGMDKYAIYYHFQSKQAVYRAVIERSLSRMTEFIDRLFPEEITSGEELEKIFQKLFDFMSKNHHVMRILQRESLDGNDVDIRETFEKYFRPLYRRGIRFSEEAKRSSLFREDINTRQFVISLYTLIMSYYNDRAMISLLLGEDALSKRMVRERRAQLAKFVMDNLAPATRK